MFTKEGWEKKKLVEMCKVFNGGTPDTTKKEFWDGSILWITPKDMGRMKSKYVDETERKITDAGLKNSSAQILPINSIIISSRAPIGHLAINTKPICTNQGCKGLVPKEGLNTQYLYYFLKNSVQLLNDLGTGATFKEISGTKLGNVKIPIPPLPTQHQIVSELDTLSDIITKKKQQLADLDALAKATFYDMFGDPVNNEKGWKVKTLQETVSVYCPISYGIVQPGEEFELGLPIVRPVDLVDTYVSIEKLKRINAELANSYKKTTLRGNEILICVRGTTGVMSLSTSELIGCNVTRGIAPLFFDNHERLYIYHLLKTPQLQQIISEKTYGIALKQINLSELRKIRLILPPINIQSQFAKKIETVHNQKQLINQSIADVNQLFDYTMDKYFN